MNIILRRAAAEDAGLIARTRRLVWEQTYRGIYPDEMLDNYNLDFFTKRDRQRLESPVHHFYVYMDGNQCVGYFSFGPYNFGEYKDFELCLNNLYICNAYKGRGLGKLAFSTIREYCKDNRINKFFCGCNLQNLPAQDFYRHMGGVVGNVSGGHANTSEDIIHFEFYLGD